MAHHAPGGGGGQAGGTQSANVGPLMTVAIMAPICLALWVACRTNTGLIIILGAFYAGLGFVSPALYFVVPPIAFIIWYRLIRVPPN